MCRFQPVASAAAATPAPTRPAPPRQPIDRRRDRLDVQPRQPVRRPPSHPASRSPPRVQPRRSRRPRSSQVRGKTRNAPPSPSPADPARRTVPPRVQPARQPRRSPPGNCGDHPRQPVATPRHRQPRNRSAGDRPASTAPPSPRNHVAHSVYRHSTGGMMRAECLTNTWRNGSPRVSGRRGLPQPLAPPHHARRPIPNGAGDWPVQPVASPNRPFAGWPRNPG